MAVQTTGTQAISSLMTTYYDKRFLKRPNTDFVFRDQATLRKTVKLNAGKVVQFARYTPLSAATTPLTEGSSGSGTSLASDSVTVTAKEYGNWVEVSNLLYLTSIDSNFAEAVDVVRENMHLTLDMIARDELKANLHAESLGEALSVAAIKELNRYLKTKGAYKMSDGYYHLIVGPNAEFALKNDQDWIKANGVANSNVQHFKDGVIGLIDGVKVIYSSTMEEGDGTGQTPTYHSILLGGHAFGDVDWEKDRPHLVFDGRNITAGKEFVPGSGDKSDPLNRKHTLGWAATAAPKVLNANWGICITSTPYTSGS
ncbi:N4-gp56 family major capsid protein [bacterium]|nr:N4-gp56 family major capsid protein [bacterium]